MILKIMLLVIMIFNCWIWKNLKIKNRFLDVNKNWGKNRNRQDKKSIIIIFLL